MNSNFTRFKRRASGIRIAKAVLAGTAAGSVLGGIFLLLSKLSIIGAVPIASLPIGIGAFLVVGAAIYLALRATDKTLARRLDEEFSLNERVQTMIEHSAEDTDMLRLQREDTETVLSGIDVRSFKAKRIWIYIVAAILGVCILTTSLVMPNMRGLTDKDDPPFTLTDMQRAGLNELISYVEGSVMEEEYKTAIADELRILISDLERVERMSGMRAELAETMAYILDITYESSTATEVLNELWDTGDTYIRYLAVALDTSSWKTPDWGDYAEKLTEYIAVLLDDGSGDEENAAPLSEEAKRQRLVWILQESARKMDSALVASGVPEADELRAVLKRLVSADEHSFKGYSALADSITTLSYEAATESLQTNIDLISEDIYDAISLNRNNAFVGEYTMTKLSTLFMVPLPEFERPNFVKNNESISDESGSGTGKDKEEGEGPSDGGIGEGATFGSKDLVLDPLTGNYVEYGTLIDKYYAVMTAKLESGSYTEKQKEMIKNYFALLYSGIKKEEG